MEGCVTDNSPPAACENNLKETDSVVNFKKFIYDLFEKNGILNDLRAYLRGHIINVLNSSQTGEPPTCQKHFTQRLELTFQALNMLIVEYLLRLEFSYSLSVFISEIPLANMVFEFAKKLMLTSDSDYEDLKFKDNDVWSILNYLGVKCDSEHASSILDLYNSKENLPLLLCILKCTPMYQTLPKGFAVDQENCSTTSFSSSVKSGEMQDGCNMQANSATKIGPAHECKHYSVCKPCQSRQSRLREKYETKKKHLIKNIKSCETNPINVEALMKNIGAIEKNLVDEMFQQLKSVYEAEVVMLRQDEEKKMKRSIAAHALQLQKKQEEMEESFKAREEELERNVQDKKKFLWGLARALRDQHASMSRAMHAVRSETERLTAKEESLKSQLLEAEDVLRKRGEEMRKQISNELMILEDHLQSMKKERESIHRERTELEGLKASCNSTFAIKMQDEDLRSHYDLLKNELVILKKYLETTRLEPKCVIERSTLTDLSDVTSKIHLVLNNANSVERGLSKTDNEGRRTPNKVVNDLKKQKNVNFRTSNVDELYRDRSRSSSEAGDMDNAGERDRDMFERMRDENERLKTFARQQREHIDELSSHQARLQAELTAVRCQASAGARPRTAPTLMPSAAVLERLNTSASANSVGWQKGAGEEISSFAHAQPRIVLPGDALPFVGVLGDRHTDNRRYLINQWRALRRRMSPIGVKGRNPTAVPRERVPRDPRPVIVTRPAAPTVSQPQEQEQEREDAAQINETFTFQAYPSSVRPITPMIVETHKPREKSPKSVLREAKEKLRNKSHTKEQPPTTTSEKSPSAVLKEAKLRLRKLEIEAEAVEKSYLNFRKRQTELKQEKSNVPETSAIRDIGNLDTKKSRSHHSTEGNYKMESVPRFSPTQDRQNIKIDFEKYLCEYESKFNASASHLKTYSGVAKSKPIPAVYFKIESGFNDTQERNYLETPLTEFRKLYHSEKPKPTLSLDIPPRSKGPTQTFETDNKTPNLPKDIPIRSESPTKSFEMDNIPPTLPLDIQRPCESLTRSLKSDNISSNNKADCARDSSESRSKSLRTIKNKQDESEILKDNFSKMYNLQDNDEIEQKIQSSLSPKPQNELKEIIPQNEFKEMIPDINEKVVSEASSLNIVESNTRGDLLLVVESTVDSREIDVTPSELDNDKISTHISVIISPKRSARAEQNEGGDDFVLNSPGAHRSVSPDHAGRLSKNEIMDAIFRADDIERHSSIEMELNISKDLMEDSNTDNEKGAEDYPDDFSADVDNYNSRSDDHSPISFPKNSDDDNFWES